MQAVPTPRAAASRPFDHSVSLWLWVSLLTHTHTRAHTHTYDYSISEHSAGSKTQKPRSAMEPSLWCLLWPAPWMHTCLRHESESEPRETKRALFLVRGPSAIICMTLDRGRPLKCGKASCWLRSAWAAPRKLLAARPNNCKPKGTESTHCKRSCRPGCSLSSRSLTSSGLCICQQRLKPTPILQSWLKLRS